MAFDLSSATPVDDKPKGGFDLASAKPVEPNAATAKAEPESPTSAKNLAGAAVEPNLALASGAIASPVSGLAGIAGSLLPGPPGQGADWTRKVGSALTYEPKTVGGKNAMEVIGYPFRKIAEGSEWAGGKVADVTGSPALGAATKTALEAAPMLLGAKGAGKLKDVPGVLPKMTPEVSPAVKLMVDKGAQLTPGQLFGGGWNRVEQALAKWPIVGAPIRGAKGRAFQDFNDAAMNDALAPVGSTIPEGMIGHDAVAHVRGKLGDRYEDILSRSVGKLDGEPSVPGTAVAVPGQSAPPAATVSLRSDLNNLKDMVNKSTLPKKYKSEFGRIIDEDIINRFQQGGVTSGETLKMIDTNLRTLAQKKGLSDNRDVNTIGLAVKEARASLKNMIDRENPGLADELKATDAAYAKFKIVQKAAANAGKNGVFTPAQFERAVKSADKSKDKRAFSEGDANMQDLAKAAKEVLGDTIPDSGTPSQLFVAALFGGAKGILGLPGGMAGALSLSLPYSKTGTKIMQRALTEPPAAGVAAARGLPIGAQQQADQIPSPP